MNNINTLCNIIHFLNNNQSIDCVEWKDLKIYEQDNIWYAENYYTIFHSDREIYCDIIAENSDISKFKIDVINWIEKYKSGEI